MPDISIDIEATVVVGTYMNKLECNDYIALDTYIWRREAQRPAS